MELAAEIRRHRTEKGLSQEELAAKIYVSRQTVSNWETDKTYPDVESLLLLSVLFDVTIDELIKGDVEAMKETVSKEYKATFKLIIGCFASMLIGTILFFGGVAYWGWNIIPSAVIFFSFYGIGLVAALRAACFYKQHDLVTFREILAFSKGEPVDRSNPTSQRARQHKRLKLVVTMLIGALVGGFLGYYISVS